MNTSLHKRAESPVHAAIAGGGLMGRLLAWRLTALGHRVSLFDAGSLSTPHNAAYTAAAMLSPMSEVVVSERAIYDTGLHSMTLWESWLAELPAQFKHLYSKRGSVVVAHPQDESELLQFHQDLQHHLGANNQSQWLAPHELAQLEPDLHFSHGLYLPNEAALNNRVFLNKLLKWLIDHNVQIHPNTPVRFAPEAQIDNIDASEFDLWFDCRGVGAGKERQVRGVRGEVIWVETDEVKLHRPIRLMHPRYKLYIVPKPNNQFIVGATEIESNDNSPMSVQSALELCSALYTLNPAFAEARIVEMDTNLRPALIDNMPCITLAQANTSIGTPVIQANGLYRHGYLLAPSAVEYALQLAGLGRAKSPFASHFNRRTLDAYTTSPTAIQTPKALALYD